MEYQAEPKTLKISTIYFKTGVRTLICESRVLNDEPHIFSKTIHFLFLCSQILLIRLLVIPT